MAEPPTSVTPASEPRAWRRASWARAFDRVKAAMKRRTSSVVSRALQTVSPEDHDRPGQEPPSNTMDMVAAAPRIPDDNAKAEPTPNVPAETMDDGPPLVADTGLDIDDDPDNNDEGDISLPAFSTRTAITDERARDLFAKYNLKYDPRGRRPQQEPPNKIRRVEKPVRLRVHWTCHECRSQFGMEKVCMNCGHRRCRECVRHPPKRAREAPQVMAFPMGGEEEQAHEAAEQPPLEGEPTVVDPDLLSYREEPAAPPLPAEEAAEDASPKGTPRTSAPVATAGEPSSSLPPLEIDDDAEEDYANLRSSQYMIYTRPRAAIHTVLKPTGQSIRRTCHECDTPMVPSRRLGCPNCGHNECDLCTPASRPEQPQAGPSTQAPDEEEVPMVRAVKRVYRKPRQRVRYQCEHCNTHFIESDQCGECGHERCQTCHREPPKRRHRQHDPEILAAVANRLAAYGGGLGRAPGITASAG